MDKKMLTLRCFWKNRRPVVCVLFLLLYGSMPATSVPAEEQQRPQVLILNSYHQGLTWSDNIVTGIQSVFEGDAQTPEIWIEFMDTKRIFDADYMQSLHRLYRAKFWDRSFDVIIASDNNAFDFLLAYQADLFPETPVVFCGVNAFDASQLQGHPLFTGVVEEVDIQGSLELALEIHPNTKQVLAINDTTTTGNMLQIQVDRAVASFEHKLEFVQYRNFIMSDLLDAVSALGPDTIILLMVVNRDASGQFFTYEQGIDMIAAHTDVPIYGSWDFYLNRGIVGGMLTSGVEQGKAAAEMALRILHGEQVSDIPVLSTSPNRPMFDALQLQRHGIAASALPEESVLLNQPSTFYHRYRHWIWGTGLSGTGLIAAIVMLAAIVRIRTARLRCANKRLFDEVKERQRAEAQATQKNTELQDTLKDLQRTQNQLILAEKMAALGKLVTNIAHEINTPLGAIRASGSNIVTELRESVEQLPRLLTRLSPELQFLFFRLVRKAIEEKLQLTSREERQLRRAMRKELESYEIEQADDIADRLIDIGIYSDISPFLELLRHEQRKETLGLAYNIACQFHHGTNILDAVERTSKIVFALKGYTQYESHEQKVKADIIAGIEAGLMQFQNQLKHGIELTTRYEEVPLIPCYPDELTQVWSNLIQNAIQAMGGKGRLKISVEASPDGSYLLVQLTDSGSGISENIRHQIFEPFFTSKASGQGSGLGLDICKKIIEKHQGDISFESRPGKTTFCVSLPICE